MQEGFPFWVTQNPNSSTPGTDACYHECYSDREIIDSEIGGLVHGGVSKMSGDCITGHCVMSSE